MINFNFSTAGKIVFGCGCFNKIGELVAGLGSNFLIVCGGESLTKNGILAKLEQQLKMGQFKYAIYKGIAGEPEPDTVDKGLEIARSNSCDAVIAIGGGSVIDTGKAVAAMISNEGSLIDYLEGVGKGLALKNNPVSCVAVPTTAGTGSEVTKNAVITSLSDRYKKSLRHEKMIPDIALVDPELTLTLPKKQTAWSGMDALTQLIESYVSLRSNPFTDALSLKGIELMVKSLRDAYFNGADIKSRENVSLASLLSGICLANSGLGAAHGFAAGIGCFYGVPHGLACAILLPHIIKVNMDIRLHKYADIGRIITGGKDNSAVSDAEALLEFVVENNNLMGIPRDLKDFNIKHDDLPDLINASKGNSMNGNPKQMDDNEMIQLISKLI